MDLVQGKMSITNGLIGNANAFPMLKHGYRCQEIAPSTYHAKR